jgi:hypothetical protein
VVEASPAAVIVRALGASTAAIYLVRLLMPFVVAWANGFALVTS